MRLLAARVRVPAVLGAIGLLGCGVALAAEPLASPSATPVKHNSLKICNQQADTRKLTGATRAQFVKHCQTEKARAGSQAPAAEPATLAAR